MEYHYDDQRVRDDQSVRRRTVTEAKAAGDEVRSTLESAREAGKERARTFFEEQRVNVAERADEIARALRKTAKNLDEEGVNKTACSLTERAAHGAEQLASSLRDQDPEELRYRAERIVRDNPGAVLAGAVTVGLLLARFLKSSGDRRHTEHDTEHDIDRDHDHVSPIERQSAMPRYESDRTPFQRSSQAMPPTGGI